MAAWRFLDMAASRLAGADHDYWLPGRVEDEIAA
jgi:hypothetical protein